MNRRPDINYETELTHLLREAGRYLHPGPREKVSQKEILILLDEQEELTQKQLAEILHKTPAAISEIVRKLDAADLIKRVPNKKDKRFFDLELTDQGRRTAREYRAQRRQKENMYSALTEPEQEMLYLLLNKLIENWRETRKINDPVPPPKAPRNQKKDPKPPVPHK